MERQRTKSFTKELIFNDISYTFSMSKCTNGFRFNVSKPLEINYWENILEYEELQKQFPFLFMKEEKFCEYISQFIQLKQFTIDIDENEIMWMEFWMILGQDDLTEKHTFLIPLENKKREVTGNLSDLVTYMKKIENDCKSNLKETVNETESKLNLKINGVEADLKEIIKETESKFNLTVDDTESKLTSKINGVESTIKETVNETESKFNLEIKEVKSTIKETVNETENKFTSKINVVESNVNSGIREMESKLNLEINGVKSTIKETVNETESKLNLKINGVESNVNGGIREAESKLTSKITAVEADFKNQIEKILTERINQMENKLLQKINGIEADFKDKMKIMQEMMMMTIGEIKILYPKLINPDNVNFTLSNGNKTVDRISGSAWLGIRGEEIPSNPGVYQFSIRIDKTDAGCSIMIGFCLNSHVGTSGFYSGSNCLAMLYLTCGHIYANSGDVAANNFRGTTGMTITAIIDTTNKLIWFKSNGNKIQEPKQFNLNEGDISKICPCIDLHTQGDKVTII